MKTYQLYMDLTELLIYWGIIHDSQDLKTVSSCGRSLAWELVYAVGRALK